MCHPSKHKLCIASLLHQKKLHNQEEEHWVDDIFLTHKIMFTFMLKSFWLKII